MTALLTVTSLSVDYGPDIPALRGVSLTIGRGETVAIVGESGSGKTTLARAVLGLLPPAARTSEGEATLGDTDLLALDEAGWRSLRGTRIGYVPQDPGTSLNPTRRVGDQVTESLRAHGAVRDPDAKRRADEALEAAGIPDAPRVARAWPHELSGGMRQRALIAGAFVAGPELIVADEPTSALDATVQRRVLDHLGALARDRGTSLLLITHDLAIALQRADRVIVMKAGEVVDAFAPSERSRAGRAPYVAELLDAVPSPRHALTRPLPDRSDVLLSVRGLSKRFGRTVAVDDASFDVVRGTTFALVGESGSGKTTLARTVLGLASPTAGEVRFDGVETTAQRGEGLRELRRRIQLVPQNPYSSFDPRIPIRRAIAEPLEVFRVGTRRERSERVDELLEQVALPRSFGGRRPGELSGGQLQRAAIARAIALRPELLVCDEPVSALDVSVQAQILDLLRTLQGDTGLAYLFITHDLGVVAEIADDVAVMGGGRIVEQGPIRRVFGQPNDPLTRDLLAAAPDLSPEKRS
ncbi:ABC transporter ATP-binding protein [Microbacterium betulae]|uniref:ABC transporter ATP-binding protein n=1 Tax=Microbacterium betulae TaxID=2981139 RepID=A0AA97FGA1_9MICO|nr:ABC transporter ATP-binding protein [Microbacterium sp. AB]WOF22348.1 ABC transporter ATP-binding protein [Microbacterium sp. AB]